MARLSEDEIVMVGGLSIPEAGPVKHHPKDSTICKLKVSEQKSTKCDDCELTKRAGHTMQVHNEKV